MKLINLRNELVKNKSNPAKITEVSEMISNEEAEENRSKLLENFGKYSDDPENINLL